MSETEDDGDIDKEALREELREKYERDEQRRESTQRMSDLLLKGATMTNAHCGTCGDPIFRQNGVNFCPTCHGGPGGVEASVPADDGSDGDDADSRQQAATEGTPTDTAPTETAPTDADVAPADGTTAPATDDNPSPDADGSTIDSAGSLADGRDGTSESHSFEQSASPTNPDATSSTRTSNATGDGAEPRAGRSPSLGAEDGLQAPVDGDRKGARDSLTIALERFAREAAATDDPRYARECLEAAHEAADALAALRR